MRGLTTSKSKRFKSLLSRKSSSVAKEEKKTAEADYISSLLMTKKRQVIEKKKNETFGSDEYAQGAIKSLTGKKT